MDASVKSAGVYNIYLIREIVLKNNLRKSIGKDVMLNICKLSNLELQQVRDVLEGLPSELLNKSDTKLIILDTVLLGLYIIFWRGL